MSSKTRVYNFELFNRLLNYIKSYRNIFFNINNLCFWTFDIWCPKARCFRKNSWWKPYFIKLWLFSWVHNYNGCLLILEVASNYSFIFNAGLLGQSVVKDIRVKVFNHIQDFKMEYYDKSSVGILITRTVTDMERIADILVRVFSWL